MVGGGVAHLNSDRKKVIQIRICDGAKCDGNTFINFTIICSSTTTSKPQFRLIITIKKLAITTRPCPIMHTGQQCHGSNSMLDLDVRHHESMFTFQIWIFEEQVLYGKRINNLHKVTHVPSNSALVSSPCVDIANTCARPRSLLQSRHVTTAQ